MLRKKRKTWMIQAFLTYQRISNKYSCYPNGLIVYKLYTFALKDWESLGVSLSWSFAIVLYIFELFGTSRFFGWTCCLSKASHYVLHLSVTEYSNILQNRWLLKNELSKPNTAFTFDHSIIALNFSCKNLEKLYDFFPNDAKQKKDSSDYDIS
jgi:hypothetical protein